MKSPFPGLDPYLEKHWGDVHTSLMPALRRQLQQQLPEGLWASVEESVTIVKGEKPDRHIAIFDTTSGSTVITVIEVLSPANKIGEQGRWKYVNKQQAYLRGGINLVEIDLIRSGDYVLSAPREPIIKEHLGKPMISVHRSYLADWEVYPLNLRDPLPNFRIPLRPRDKDAVLQLQAAMDECYADAQYGRRIDYAAAPEPRLGDEDATWAKELLKDPQ